jgi:hypothetical protein
MNEPRSNGLQMNGAGKCVDMGMGGGKSPYDAGGQDMSKQSGGMNEPTLKGITPNEHVQRTVGSLGGAMNEPRYTVKDLDKILEQYCRQHKSHAYSVAHFIGWLSSLQEQPERKHELERN